MVAAASRSPPAEAVGLLEVAEWAEQEAEVEEEEEVVEGTLGVFRVGSHFEAGPAGVDKMFARLSTVSLLVLSSSCSSTCSPMPRQNDLLI